MVVKIKSVQPKTGKTHKLFGSRFLKWHNIRDSKWTTKDKFIQYKGLTTLHGKIGVFLWNSIIFIRFKTGAI